MQQNATGLEFDEQTYLARNPDVAAAVGAGRFASGLDHFMKFGRHEHRPGVTVDPTRHDNADPHPPEHLRLRVHGGRDLEGYLRVGQVVSGDLDRLLESGELRIPQGARVLDFGSGPGRVVTWFRRGHPNWQFFGTDIDAEAIDWAQSHLGGIATFACNESMPPLRYSDGYFDFIYSISIFTHLPEEMQTAWLRELTRVTKKGGCLVLTTHSEDLLPKSVSMPAEGFYYSVGPGTDGLPGFYQTSFQTNEYIRREWSKYFTIEKIIKRGVANHQDLVVCRV